MKHRRTAAIPYFDSGVYLLLLLWLTLSPKPTGDLEVPLFPGADKIVHCGMFFCLSVLVWWDATCERLLHRRPLLSKRILAAVAASSGALGVALEIAQWQMAVGRAFEWGDIAGDLLGAALSFPAMLFLGRRLAASRA